MFNDVMGSFEAKICFLDAFLALLNQEEPICRLKTLPHWRTDNDILSLAETYFFEGFFYNFFTPVPSFDVLIDKIQLVKDTLTVDQLIIPSVRVGESSLLKKLGFHPYNFEKELIFQFDEDVDLTLRNVVGGHKLREIKRLHRNSFDVFTFEWINSEAICDSLLDELDKLDIKHVVRHKSVRRIYTRNVNISFINSRLSGNFRWFVRRNITSGEVVQLGLILFGNQGGTLYYLNQSIDRERCYKQHNLYIAAFYEIYKLAQQMGFRCVHMGRGLEQVKLNLGANKIIEQASWILKL